MPQAHKGIDSELGKELEDLFSSDKENLKKLDRPGPGSFDRKNCKYLLALCARTILFPGTAIVTDDEGSWFTAQDLQSIIAGPGLDPGFVYTVKRHLADLGERRYVLHKKCSSPSGEVDIYSITTEGKGQCKKIIGPLKKGITPVLVPFGLAAKAVLQEIRKSEVRAESDALASPVRGGSQSLNGSKSVTATSPKKTELEPQKKAESTTSNFQHLVFGPQLKDVDSRASEILIFTDPVSYLVQDPDDPYLDFCFSDPRIKALVRQIPKGLNAFEIAYEIQKRWLEYSKGFERTHKTELTTKAILDSQIFNAYDSNLMVSSLLKELRIIPHPIVAYSTQGIADWFTGFAHRGRLCFISCITDDVPEDLGAAFKWLESIDSSDLVLSYRPYTGVFVPELTWKSSKEVPSRFSRREPDKPTVGNTDLIKFQIPKEKYASVKNVPLGVPKLPEKTE